MSKPIPSYDELYGFIKRHYRHSRFEGRVKTYGEDYPRKIVDGYMDDLKASGWSIISWHESQSGRHIVFDSSLAIKPEEDSEKATEKGHLTHLF